MCRGSEISVVVLFPWRAAATRSRHGGHSNTASEQSVDEAVSLQVPTSLPPTIPWIPRAYHEIWERGVINTLQVLVVMPPLLGQELAKHVARVLVGLVFEEVDVCALRLRERAGKRAVRCVCRHTANRARRDASGRAQITCASSCQYNSIGHWTHLVLKQCKALGVGPTLKAAELLENGPYSSPANVMYARIF